MECRWATTAVAPGVQAARLPYRPRVACRAAAEAHRRAWVEGWALRAEGRHALRRRFALRTERWVGRSTSRMRTGTAIRDDMSKATAASLILDTNVSILSARAPHRSIATVRKSMELRSAPNRRLLARIPRPHHGSVPQRNLFASSWRPKMRHPAQ